MGPTSMLPGKTGEAHRLRAAKIEALMLALALQSQTLLDASLELLGAAAELRDQIEGLQKTLKQHV